MGINILCLYLCLNLDSPLQVISIEPLQQNIQKLSKIKKVKIYPYSMALHLETKSKSASNDNIIIFVSRYHTLYQEQFQKYRSPLEKLYFVVIIKTQQIIIQLIIMQSSQDIKLPPINNNSSYNGPFKVPNDNQILLNTDNTKSRMKDQKIWDKTTASCRNPLKRFDKYQFDVDDKYVPVNNFNNKEKKVIETALQIIKTRKKNKDLLGKNQTIVDILQQKKQMFLVTMTHGIIEKQIKNLKNQADERERALKQSNEILDQDITDFSQFQQKQKAQTKRIEDAYEKQVQKRLAKQQQIKSKLVDFNSLKALNTRNQQSISSYQKYKIFLNKLPPEQWRNQQQVQKNERLQKLKAQMYTQWVAAQDKKASEAKLKADFQAYFQGEVQNGLNKKISKILYDDRMYFNQPKQLIEYFNNLQEANLFCIQNVQIADQKLQQLVLKSEERKKQLFDKYQIQLDQKKALQRQLVELEYQIKGLKKKREQNSALDGKDNKDIKMTIAGEYQNMKDQMTTTYLPEIQHNSQALALLSGIEICMERLWQKLRQCYNQNPKLIKQIKNQYQKKKTIEKRKQTAQINKLQDERRKERNLDKKEPTQKINGRLDMRRSAPNQKVVKKKLVSNQKNFNDDLQYLLQ